MYTFLSYEKRFDLCDLYEDLRAQVKQNRSVQTFFQNRLTYSKSLNFLKRFGYLTETI